MVLLCFAAMISFENLAIARGADVLFAGADAAVYAGQRVGIVGNNGCGKSTLFAVLRGELEPEAGTVAMPPDVLIASVRQETPSLAQAAVEYVLDGHQPYRRALAALERAEAEGDGMAIAAAHDELAAVDGYALPARAAALLQGLGFEMAQQRRLVADFSGGWRMRLNLAQALIAPADVLLLDEPTNHLDIDAVIFLQDFLKGHPASQLIIAHDREFLDALAERIFHIENRRLTAYTGNYSQFERLRYEKRLQEDAAYAKQEAARAHLQSYVDRFRAKASKAKQAQSRLKALAKLDLQPPPPPEQQYRLAFPEPEVQANALLKLEKAALGYDAASPVIAPVTLTIAPDTRLGLLGRNGAGKSTLLKTLAGTLAPLSGVRTAHQHCRIGYYTQHQLDRLVVSESPLEHMQRLYPQTTAQEHRNFLGAFGFGGEKADSPIAPFSGGEKARLALALITAAKPNVLLLDEPTNHLDIAMRSELNRALQDYSGAVVIISHDRSLLASVCTEFAAVGQGKYQPFDGDLEDYRSYLQVQESEAKAAVIKPSESRQAQKRSEAEIRRVLRPYKQAAEKAENRIEKLEAEAAALEAQLADSAVYEEANKEKLKKLLDAQAANAQAMQEAENEWERAMAALQQAEEMQQG